MSSGPSSEKTTYEEENSMSEVTRVNDPSKAPPDGVELHAKCVVTKFITNEKKKLVTIKGQEVQDCKIMASYQTGTVSISVPGKAMMVSARIDEVMAVLQEAAEAARDVAGPVRPREGGPLSLYCLRCRCWVPDTASAEMKKEGYYSHSHVCGDMTHGEIPDEEGRDGQ